MVSEPEWVFFLPYWKLISIFHLISVFQSSKYIFSSLIKGKPAILCPFCEHIRARKVSKHFWQVPIRSIPTNMPAYHKFKDVKNGFPIETNGIKRLIFLGFDPIINVTFFLLKKNENFIFSFFLERVRREVNCPPSFVGKKST